VKLRENFTGARDVSAVHSLMGKWALLAVAVFLACSLSSLSAQTTRRTDLLARGQSRVANSGALDLSALNSGYYGFPTVALLDGRPLSLSEAYTSIDQMPEDFLPTESRAFSASVSTASSSSLRDSDGKTVEVKPKVFDYVHGEVGFLYGTSAGSKFSRELEQGYILGEMGNDKFRVNVGAFYEHSSAHFPRR
jgi:hypothetical protein